jgi:hypothetical protein
MLKYKMQMKLYMLKLKWVRNVHVLCMCIINIHVRRWCCMCGPHCTEFNIRWKLLIMITLGLALFDNNNRMITLSGGYKNLSLFNSIYCYSTTFYNYN